MLKLFRRIRQKLIDERNLQKYLIYAVGEIVLVVIGILIALNINNWNQSKIETDKEEQIVRDVFSELSENEIYLNKRDSFLNRTLKSSSIKLLKLTSPNPKTINSKELHRLTKRNRGVPPFTPITSTFSKLITSEDFNLLKKDSFKVLLIEYKALLERLGDDYDNIKIHMRHHQEPYYQERLNWKDMVYGDSSFSDGFEDIDTSKFEVDLNRIISDQKFENIIAGVLVNYGFVENTNKLLVTHIRNMKSFIERNYPLQSK